MDSHARTGKPLALEPLALPATTGETLASSQNAALRVTSADEFLAHAAKEYQDGQIDKALWERTATRHAGDESLLVAAYLRSRATALQMRKRNEHAVPHGPQPMANIAARSTPPLDAVAAANAMPRKRAGSRRKLVYGVAVAGLIAAVGIVWLVASPSATVATAQPAAVARAVPRNAVAASAAPAQAVSPPVAAAAQEPSLETKVQDLKRAGNWNVLVLYASEWTRKQPDNANAWTELSAGFVKMRQWGDALEAARKAVELAPDELKHWRNLGHVTLVVERLPEARTAFDRILSTFPDDVDALCGASLVASGENRPKDAETLATRVKALGVGCDGVFEGVTVPVAASSAPAPVVTSGAPPRRAGSPAPARNR